MIPSLFELKQLKQQYETALFEQVIPFWEKYSPDEKFGGYFTCLTREGSVYDTTKYAWLQGRQAWMFAKLYSTVEERPEWLRMAKLGIAFLQEHALRKDGRVYFSLSESGSPIYLQRKIFSECFYIMALSAYARAAEAPKYLVLAKEAFEQVWEWAFDWSNVGRPTLEGATPFQTLAVPMILLNLIEEIAGDDYSIYQPQIDLCIQKMQLHIHPEKKLVYENVLSDGTLVESSEGRLINPGHAIEAGWFLQHWAQRLNNEALSKTAIEMVRSSFEKGWDKEAGGIYYFLDAQGFSPTQLEWHMKLWWPHTEALYAFLLHFSLTQNFEDWQNFLLVQEYSFQHFADPTYGEWFGYLDRFGNKTHEFKGGPYKGCFHVPRSLYLCWKLLCKMIDQYHHEN